MSRHCSECGSERTPFKGRTFVVEHAGLKRQVAGLSGWQCSECDEIVFDAASAKRYAAAGDALITEDRASKSGELKRIRQKLGLSQQQASMLTGGGHNAFSRYELGKAAPMTATVNLFRVLDKHPELLSDDKLGLLPKSSMAFAAKKKSGKRARASKTAAQR